MARRTTAAVGPVDDPRVDARIKAEIAASAAAHREREGVDDFAVQWAARMARWAVEDKDPVPPSPLHPPFR